MKSRDNHDRVKNYFRSRKLFPEYEESDGGLATEVLILNEVSYTLIDEDEESHRQFLRFEEAELMKVLKSA